MMICSMRAHRQWKAVTIDDRHDLGALATSGRAELGTTALGTGKRYIDEALAFVNVVTVAKLILRRPRARISDLVRQAGNRRMRSEVGQRAILDSGANVFRKKSFAGVHEAILEGTMIGFPCVDEAILR